LKNSDTHRTIEKKLYVLNVDQSTQLNY